MDVVLSKSMAADGNAPDSDQGRMVAHCLGPGDRASSETNVHLLVPTGRASVTVDSAVVRRDVVEAGYSGQGDALDLDAPTGVTRAGAPLELAQQADGAQGAEGGYGDPMPAPSRSARLKQHPARAPLAGEEIDLQTLRGCMDGDEASLTRMVQMYQVRIEKLVAGMLAGRAISALEPCDIVQEVLIKACGALVSQKYVPSGNKLSTWILRIAFHETIDHLRRLGRQLPLGQSVAWDEYVVSIEEFHQSSTRAADGEHRKALRSAIGRAVACLPDAQRIVFVLSELGGLSDEEIAYVVHIPPQRVGTLIHREKDEPLSDEHIGALIGKSHDYVRTLRHRARNLLKDLLAGEDRGRV